MLFLCIKSENTGLVMWEMDHTGKRNAMYPINSRLMKRK
jgi:hypothetical protein